VNTFSVRVRTAGDATVIEVGGDLDMFTAERLEPALAAVAPGTPTYIDLGGCDYVDSAGLHVLMTYARSIGPASVTLVLPPHSPLRRVLEITGLDRFFQTVADLPR